MGIRAQRGQQTTEFAILLAMAATVAIGMQLYVRRSLQAGVAGASDTILGKVPTSSSPTSSSSPALASNTPCDPIALASKPDPSIPLCVTSAAGTDEEGRPSPTGPARTIYSVSGIRGHSFNRDVRDVKLRTTPEAGTTNPGTVNEPGQEN